MDEGRNVWVPDAVHGYIIGCIKDIGSDTITVEPTSTPGKTVTAAYEQVFLSEEYQDKDVDDNCEFYCMLSIAFYCYYYRSKDGSDTVMPKTLQGHFTVVEM